MQEAKFEHNTNFHHIVPTKVYWTIFFLLGILTVITVYVAYLDLGVFNVPVALAIATLKATLVALYFMHVRYSGKLVHMCIISGIAFFILLIFGTLQDYWTRENIKLPAPTTDMGAAATPPMTAPQQALPQH